MITYRINILKIYFLASVLVVSMGLRAQKGPCLGRTTCSDCIRTTDCAWCFAAAFSGPRCFNPSMTGDTAGCNEAHIFNPDNLLHIDPLYNKELSKDDVHKLTFAYSRAQDYPLDLYYLMDLSNSMERDKEKLSTLGNLLSTTMRNITSDFRIGFGSFVDKLVMPYVSMIPKNLKSPCTGCAAPYGYQNHMSLSKNTDYFEKAVSNAAISGNLDNPEGGFDAIMQAIVCKKEIGWREKATRLLVFSTDSGFHYAGDGKLAGIVKPNDGECHMKDNVYTHSTILDYPSISHIDLKVKEHNINLIFAVTQDRNTLYKELSQLIEGSSSGVLSNYSANVVELVRDQYNKITSTLEIKDNSRDEIQIMYYSSCLSKKDPIQTNLCDGLKVGQMVGFTAEITLKECPKDPSQWKQMFQIYPVGVSESLTVELEMICDCPCEHPGHTAYKKDSAICSGYGTSQCGICRCDSGRFGKSCECSDHESVSLEQESGCRPTNISSGPICSNRGSCICGVCQCNKLDDSSKVISGPFCECDNFTCDMNKGQICSGPTHGECVCGKCSCRPEYSGPACQCLRDQAPCRSPGNGESCSGNGKCMCGQCVCNVDDNRHYSGKYCDKCPTCEGRCKDFNACVLCEVHRRGEIYDQEMQSCGNCSLNPVVEEGKIEAKDSLNEHLCNSYDDEDCLYVYVYSYAENKRLIVRAQKELECPKKVFILGLVLGLIASIVLVGLALLMLWKIVTTIHDRREFAKFEKERAKAKWDTAGNPIYKQATTTFQNPTYVEDS